MKTVGYIALAGLGVGAYFLLKPKDEAQQIGGSSGGGFFDGITSFLGGADISSPTKKTTTTTTESGGATPTTSVLTASSPSVSSGSSSTKKATTIKDSSGKIIGIDDPFASKFGGQSRLSSPIEQILGRPVSTKLPWQ